MRNDQDLENIVRDRRNDMIDSYSRMFPTVIDQKIEKHYGDLKRWESTISNFLQ